MLRFRLKLLFCGLLIIAGSLLANEYCRGIFMNIAEAYCTENDVARDFWISVYNDYC